MTLPETIIVMLVWANSSGAGGLTKVDGFQTLAACEAAIPIISGNLLSQSNYIAGRISAKCVEMQTR